MSRLSRVVKCSAAAVACMLTLSGCNNYSKMMKDEPQEYIKLASENTAAAMEGTAFEAEKAVLEKALKEGTLTFEAESEGVKISGTGYANEKSMEFSNIFSIEKEGNTAEGYIAGSKKEVKFGTIGYSGTHIYSMTLETLEDDFAKSLFAPGSGSDVELSASDYNTALQAIKEAKAALEGKELDTDSQEKKLEDAAAKMIEDNPPTIEEKVDYTLDGTEVKANILTYNFNKDILKQLADVYVDVTIEEMTAQGSFDENYTAEDYRESYEETFANIETLDAKVVYYVNSKSHCLMKCDVEMDIVVEDDAVAFDAVTTFGAEPTAVGKKTVELALTAMGQLYTATINYDYVSDDKTVVDIKASGQGAALDVATLTFEKADGRYTISVNIPLLTAKASVEGALATADKSVEFTVDKVAYTVAETEETMDFALKMSASQGGTYDDRAAEKGFFELTEEELEAFAENAENDFSGVLEGGDMSEYVETSKIATANANAKQIQIAFSSALTQMGINGVKCTETEFMNETDGDIDIICNDYDLDLASWLGEDYAGYYYVSVDPEKYMVKYTLWSEEPIEQHYQFENTEQFYQFADYEQKNLADDGVYVGAYLNKLPE
ncbi:MAG: hypothetical protein IJZ72_04065 [Oscillospiraceae bacterium]|nr:hypothetical protein [Oscillospiraceae bacterium]